MVETSSIGTMLNKAEAWLALFAGRQATALEDLVYEFARPLETLRVKILDDPKRRWRSRTVVLERSLTLLLSNVV